MPKPWESAPVEHQAADGPKPWESAPAEHQETPDVVLPDGLKPFKLDNGSVTVQRPSDGAVYIKESNDSRFKGQEGWHYRDPKTGVWVPAPAKDPAKMGWLERNLGPDQLKSFGRNLKVGVQSPINNVLDLGNDAANALGLQSDQTYRQNIAASDQREAYRQALGNIGGKWAKAAQVEGEAIPMTAAMLVAPELAPASAPTISRLAATGLKTMPYVYATTHGDQAERLKAGTIAGLAAPAVELGINKVVVPAAKLVGQGIKALVKGGGTPMSTEAAQVTAQAAEHDIPLSTGETLPTDSRMGRMVRGVEDSAEPTARWFNNTHEAHDKAGQAANKILTDVQKKGQAMGFENEAVFRRAFEAAPHNSQLRALDSLIKKAESGDPADVAEASANLKNWNLRREIGDIYDRARAAAANLRKPNSSLKNVKAAMGTINKEIEALPPSARSQFSDIVEIGADYEKSLSKGADTTIRRYNSLDAMSNRLGDLARDATDATKARYYSMVQEAIEADKRGLAIANPGSKFSKLYQDADQRFFKEITPYEDGAVAKALRSSTPDEVYGQFMKRGGFTDRGLKFFEVLDPKGQQAVREKFMQDAIDSATDRTLPGQPFDPHKFVGFLDDYRGARKVIMGGSPEGDLLNGLQNVMMHMKVRPNSSVKPTFFSTFSAGGAAVLNSAPVKKLLLAADNLSPGSNKLEQLIATYTSGKKAADAVHKEQP